MMRVVLPSEYRDDGLETSWCGVASTAVWWFVAIYKINHSWLLLLLLS